MQLVINGQARQLENAGNVAELMAALELNPALVAVERNGALVPRSRHGSEALTEGDRIEIVRFIGGG
ncbi:MAG: sulfur carrier protein ThiS [Alphaproteobacteria bacterium]|nr:sulfur carrier protein ThiS [Alphaproteobacteria bacterium]